MVYLTLDEAQNKVFFAHTQFWLCSTTHVRSTMLLVHNTWP
ncbi:unnamed protein product [Haemonchus placei]|uniref:Uncharacterized protein n=1 Tax=Haemonchus placei TaxID=6290 RepID=A0A0N4VYH5_HAEPC|nr:unnamed protein product [Haemonchus placei]